MSELVLENNKTTLSVTKIPTIDMKKVLTHSFQPYFWKFMLPHSN